MHFGCVSRRSTGPRSSSVPPRPRLQPLRWPERWPPDTRTAMLAATYAKQIGRAVAFSLAAFRQAFAGGRDLGDTDTVLIAAAACEMHPTRGAEGNRAPVDGGRARAGRRARTGGRRRAGCPRSSWMTVVGRTRWRRLTGVKANRAFQLIVAREGLEPAFLADRDRLDRIEVVSIDDGRSSCTGSCRRRTPRSSSASCARTWWRSTRTSSSTPGSDGMATDVSRGEAEIVEPTAAERAIGAARAESRATVPFYELGVEIEMRSAVGTRRSCCRAVAQALREYAAGQRGLPGRAVRAVLARERRGRDRRRGADRVRRGRPSRSRSSPPNSSSWEGGRSAGS